MRLFPVFFFSAAVFIALPVRGDVDPQTALNLHNQVRSTLNQGGYPGQPIPNPSLALMFWDQGLADSATAYANECVWQHSDNRINTGENLYASTDTASDIGDAVGVWADEYRYYDFSTGDCDPGEQCGHYTQLVWQDTLLVGCGDAVCTPLRRPDGSVLFDVGRHQVCHYATAGNINGNAPYETDGGNASLVPSYSTDTGVFTLPYGLIWPPTNVVEPTTASFSVHGTSPLVFSLDSSEPASYLPEEGHVPIYDTNSQRLFLPNVDVFVREQWERHSAVLRHVPGSVSPILLQLEYVR